MKRNFLYCIGIVAIFFLLMAFPVYSQVVDNALGSDLERIFPELKNGYIDLNDNGRKDQTVDLDEEIPESRVKDKTIQAQEILGFIIENYRFIPLSSLYEVRKSLENAKGEIPELISLSYRFQIDDIIVQKEQLGEEGIFLTPSAMKEVMDKMEGFIATMALAYKKEGRSAENDFIKARDELLSMIVKGYPLPEDLSSEDRGVLVSSMINTVIKEKAADPDRVRAAIKTLGRLESDIAVPYIMEVLDLEEFKSESIQALGSIGSKSAQDLLTEELGKTTKTSVKNEIIRSLGKIGGEESLERILSLFPAGSDGEIDRDMEISLLKALSSIAAGGNTDQRIFKLFEKYLTSPDTGLRIIAVQGIARFNLARTADLLFGMLKTEKEEEVLLWIIRSVNKVGSQSTVPTLSTYLRNDGVSEKVRIEIIHALGNNAGGTKALPFIVENLNSPSPDVRRAVTDALLTLYKVDGKTVTAILSRGLLTATEAHYLIDGTAVLAKIADPGSINTLYTLLQKPIPEVKKNVTWALFRTRTTANARIVDALNKLVTSETEPIDVRINAARALGAMGFDSAALKVWQTMVTTAKMRGGKYTMLRMFAIRALGDMGTVNEEVKSTLSGLALREENPELKIEALSSIQKLSLLDDTVEKSLVNLFKRNQEEDIRIRVVEVLGDMGSAETPGLAGTLLSGALEQPLKIRVVYALSRTGGEEAYSAILDASQDASLRDYIQGVLEGANMEELQPLVSRRLKTEGNPEIVSLLEDLQEGFDTQF